jgi:outer membrane protein OmpA-like peptidoglycan-associated protein
MKNTSLFVLLFIASQLYAQYPKPVAGQALLKVTVIDNKNKPQTGQPVTFTDEKTNIKYSDTTNAEGKFSMLIPSGHKYKVSYKIFTASYNELVLDMPESAKPYIFEYTITVSPPRTFTLDNVFFDSGKATLRTESDKEMNELAEFMSLKKSITIEIAGHTDNVGTATANQELSEKRANAVKQYLQKKGIAPNRILAKGYGDTEPVADNNTLEGKQKNRRTEVHILSE